MRIEPPWPLDGRALAHWDRQIERIHAEGRSAAIDRDLLAVYSETLALYSEILCDVRKFGPILEGRQSARVKHPALSPLAACRADLVRLGRGIPLIDPAVGTGDDLGALLDRLEAES